MTLFSILVSVQSRQFSRLIVDTGAGRPPCPNCGRVPVLAQVPVSPGQIDFSKLTHITLSRKSHQYASDIDFVMRLSPQSNLQTGRNSLVFLLDTWRSMSYVFAWNGRRGFQATTPKTDAGCFDYHPIGRVCEYVSDNMHAGTALIPIPQLWLTYSRIPGVDGVIGGNRLGLNFQRDFVVFPDTSSTMKLVFNPPDLSSLICRGGYMSKLPLTADAYSKGTWQVLGRLGCGEIAAVGEVVLSTGPSPVLLESQVFANFKSRMKWAGARMYYHSGLGAFKVNDCRRYKQRFPVIEVNIGDFTSTILPEDYTYFSHDTGGGCLIDVDEAKNGIMQLGPAFLRNHVVWFRESSVGMCLRV